MSTPKTAPLPTPSHKLTSGTAAGSAVKNWKALMPSSAFAETAPPTSATPDVHSTSSGSATARAAVLGRIKRKVFEMPITESASSSSVTLMTPSWAVIADPERPATRIEQMTGPSSRTMPMPRMLTMRTSAPTSRSCSAER